MTKTIAVLIGIMFVQIGPVIAADRARIGVPQQVIHSMTFPLATALLPPPFDYQGAKLGFHSLVRAHDFINYPEDGVIAHTRKIKDKPDEIKRVIRAGIRANRYIRAEREGTIQFLMEWQKVNRETAAANYDHANKIFPDDGAFSETGLRLIIDEAKKAAKVEREVALNEVADPSILKEAQRELGTKVK